MLSRQEVHDAPILENGSGIDLDPVDDATRRPGPSGATAVGDGGGGATPQSRLTRSAGYYAIGAGIYNYDTALANNINGQTAIMMNNAWAQAQREDNIMHEARVQHDAQRIRTLYNQHIQQLRDRPGQREIENGDALNLAVQDLSDPRLGSIGPPCGQRLGARRPDRRCPVPECVGAGHLHAQRAEGRRQVAEGFR